MIYKTIALLLVLNNAVFVYGQMETLKSVAPFPIGCAIDPDLLMHNKDYNRVVSDEFNSITTENVLKFATVHPQKDAYSFAKGDILVDYALANNKRIHGHCLAWHMAVPNWLKDFKGDSTAWEALLQAHINTVVGHYKGKITSWDVVNEAFDDDGSYRKIPANDKRGKETLWRNHLGTDYIARAFIYAHKADPNVLLFYNDYGQEYSEKKLAAIIGMVKDFKRRGIPINGLGLQMHISINTKEEGIVNALKQYASTGLLIHISELDIKVNPKRDSLIVYSDSLKELQAKKFAFVVEQYKKLIPPKQQYGITFWNVGDADSWIAKWQKTKDWPLLFGKDYERKDCYYRFLNALK